MKVECEQLPGSQVELTIEVEPEVTQQSLEGAYRRLVGRVNIHGFRRGKAPRHIVERFLGPEALAEESLRTLLPQVYHQAIAQVQVSPVDEPNLEVLQHEPLVVKATVPVRPKVELGNYRQIRLSRDEPRVTEAQVDDYIQFMHEQRAEWVPVERPIAEGDEAIIDVTAFTGHRPLLYSPEGQELLHADQGKVVLERKEWDYKVLRGWPSPLAGFAERLIGMQAGEEREFRLPVPSDDVRYQGTELSGKELTFHVKLHQVREKHLPPLDDEFARAVSGQDNIEGLRQEVRDKLLAQAKLEEEGRLANLVADMACAQVQLELPEVMVLREADRLASSRQRFRSESVEDYLQRISKSEDQLRVEVRGQAERNLKALLVVESIGDAEGVQVTEEEIEQELQRLALARGDAAQVRQEYADPQRRDGLEARLRFDKTVNLLVEMATRPDEEPGAGEAEAAAAEAVAQEHQETEPSVDSQAEVSGDEPT